MVVFSDSISTIAFYILGKMHRRMANQLAAKAIKYLLETCAIQTLHNLVPNTGFTYWSIKINIGK